MRTEILRKLNAERAARRGSVLVTHLAGGRQRLVPEAEIAGDALAGELAQALATGKSGIVQTPGGEVFLNVHVPSPRVVVIGAVHIAQAFAPMARIAGFDVTIVDPRTAFATPDRFEGEEVVAEWPEPVLSRRPLDAYTALVAVTHDPKIDDLPLQEALRAGCFYVGALGSRKTHGRRVERLLAAGCSEAEIARIEAPIGLDIAAATPAEIAVAVLGSVVRALRRRGAPA